MSEPHYQAYYDDRPRFVAVDPRNISLRLQDLARRSCLKFFRNLRVG